MKINLRRYKELYKEVFASEAGQIVLHDICNRFHMMSAIKNDEFKNGERNVALFILAQVNFDLNKYLVERDKYKLERIEDDN